MALGSSRSTRPWLGPVDWWTVAGRRIPAPGPLKKDDGAEQPVAPAKSLPQTRALFQARFVGFERHPPESSSLGVRKVLAELLIR